MINNTDKYKEFRAMYPCFYYHGYEVREEGTEIILTYFFEIEGLASFAPSWRFPKGERDVSANPAAWERMVFSLGMVELISYWKIACPPRVIVEAAGLTDEQIAWWKELYFNGLGEFYYTNGIQENIDDFMEMISTGKMTEGEEPLMEQKEGFLVPVGGGKDSAVTLELLKKAGAFCRCYIINPRGATINSVTAGGFRMEDAIIAKRTLDANMLVLNQRGFLNGHTPFSAIVAFSATIAAYLHGLFYIALSNESSANESTVMGSTVNHQYSKSFKFEKDFHTYEKQYVKSGTYYFSLLRPLSEFQIAAYFAKCTQYHGVFRSCNAGSKEDIWCGHCPKCLFVYLILSPFLSSTALQEIFGRNMLEDASMLPVMEQLIGVQEEKPFECVGSRGEINTAVTMAIQKREAAGESLPLLLRHYKETDLYRDYASRPQKYASYCDEENLLPKKLMELVRRECISEEGMR